ncbi:unnamed protein product [Larinioides sclopetarius]|uniref:Transcription factor TFIIIC triple barrel domain-containing protein n=1 Tax=Larinioides sclopetarius TaxID=280406 RepID=A0AAV1ZBE8_9ARAC
MQKSVQYNSNFDCQIVVPTFYRCLQTKFLWTLGIRLVLAMENSDSEYETEGIDTDEPLLQLGNCLFKGEYEDTLGTVVLYEPVDGSQKDGLESNESGFRFLCKTDTKLTMKRCFPQERSMDNLKSVEIPPPVAIQNDEPKKSVIDTKKKTSIKKKIVSKKKKITKPKPKKFKSKKNAKNDQTNSVEKQNKETTKLEASAQLIENMADDNLLRSDTISSEVLNLEKGDQSKASYSESLELQDNKKKTEIPKKRRKRNRNEANADAINSHENIDLTQKKLRKLEEAEGHVADKESKELDNSDNKKSTAILSGTEAFLSETDRRDEQMADEECVIEALVSTVVDNESKTKDKKASVLASETSKGRIRTEECIEKTSESIATNDANEASDMDGKEKQLIEESVPTVLSNTVVNNEIKIQENIATIDASETSASDKDRKENPLIEENAPTVLSNTLIDNESQIQEKTVINIPEIDKMPVVELKNVIEPVNNTVEANDSKITDKCTHDTSVMNIGDIGLEAGMSKRMEDKVVNIESEIQQKKALVGVLEKDKNEFVVEEESVAEALDNAINNVENLIHEESLHLNTSDNNASVSVSGKTQNSLILKHDAVIDNDNCPSSSDMEHTRKEGTSEQADVCESSDDTVNLHPATEDLEKNYDDDASLSCQENTESLPLEKKLVEEDEVELSISSDNFAGNSEEKDAIYVVSQSENVDTTGKSDETEGQCTPDNSADESVSNTMDNLKPISVSDMSTPSNTEENSSLSGRKHSSWEVTQSLNSGEEYLENKDLVNEFEVFSEKQNDNLEKNVIIEVDDQLQTTEVECSESSLKSKSTASEINQSSQESKFPEENLPVEFEADGAVCTQSTEKPVILPEFSTEGRDLCVSSCDSDDKDKEKTQKEVYFSSGEDVDLSNSEENETNVICEVSQSDESEKNIHVLSELSENEAKMLSNECDESFSNTEDNLNNAITNQHICEITGSIVPSTSSIHEVTQSCSIKDGQLSDLSSEKNISNECNKNEESHAPTELYDDKLKYYCVSSADVPAVSETLLEIEADSEEKDLNSEISQSFRPTENQQFDETSEVADSKTIIKEIKIEETAAEFKYPSEVSQSVELESPTSLYNQQTINECDRAEPISDSLKSYSIEYHIEICESSDDASNIGSNSHVEEVQPVKYSTCEVSQSFRSEETVLTTKQSSDSEMESSNECEVSATSVEPDSETNKLNTCEKNICESSDDVNEFESEVIIDQVCEREKSICESSDDVNETESEITVDQLNKNDKNICESSEDINGTESQIIVDLISDTGKNICESSDDINETESEIIIDQISDTEKNICESSDDINEIESEIIIDQINDTGKNICESSDDINEIESEIIIDQLGEKEKNICESSDDINEIESEIIIDQLNEREKNVCESSDDINETESEIIIVQLNEREKNVCESSDDINETESEIIIDQISEREKNICESSDDVSENFGGIQHTPIHLEGDTSDEACQSSKSDENVLSACETEVLTLDEEHFTKCETSVEINNIKCSTICESSEDTIRMGLNDHESNSDACTSSDKSVIESSNSANLHGNKSSASDVTVGDIENNQISQSSNVACGIMDLSVNGAENSMISQSGSSVNIPIYKTRNESENSQISQSGGYLEEVSVTEIESEISQSEGVTGGSDVVALNETENNQISQSGYIINTMCNVAVEETENDQISQSESTVGHLNNLFVTEAENNQISQSGSNERVSNEITLNEVDNSHISQSGTVASCSANISVTETENNLISQSGSVSLAENENNQISQSGNVKEFLYDRSINESDNNQISQSSSSSNLPNNEISREMGNNQISQSGNTTDTVSETENNQISQSGNTTDTVSETENNQISQSSSSECTLIKESENYQISQSSNSYDPSNILSSNETENSQISQSECNDNVYQLNQTLPSDSPFQAEVVNISSSSDIVSSNYIDVTNSSFHVSNSTISSNSEVSASLGRVRPHIWDKNSLVTSVTTSEMRTSVLSSELTNEIEFQSAQTSAHLAVSSCSVIIGENRENVTSMDQEMSSSNNINEVVESSLSLIHEEDEANKFIPKDNSPVSVSESVIEEMPSTSQNLNRINEDGIQNTETSSSKNKLNRKDLQSSVSGNSLQKQFEFNPNLLQTSFLPCVSSQSDIRNNSASTRPSFLEVMASSASDFRNSLLSDNSFGKDKSHISPAPESSGSNISSCGEFSESFIREADGLVRRRSSDNVSQAPENLSALTDNSDPAYSEVSRSSGIKRKYSDSSEFGHSHHQVSQSSDVVNTLSSTSRTHALISDNISQSSQQDFVQSSSNILRTSVLVSNDSASLIDQVSSADENTSFVNKDSENADISESSIGVEAALPSCSQNTFSMANSNQLIESSSDQPTFTEEASDFKPENTESEVSSTPSETQYAGFKVLADGKDKFPAIQGNVIILPGTSNAIDESAVDLTTVQVISPDSDYVPLRSESVLILDTSNEAETLNRSSVSSPIAVQLSSFGQAAVSVNAVSQARIPSGSPLNEVETVNYEESGEVSESLMNSQNDISQSSLGDNNVSCSISEFSATHRALNTNYSFPDISQEAESKSSDDCISSYHSTCDNILPVPNLQSSADREFYSHVGEFDDSVQSSLDETHLAINEQIKAISSPPNSSDSASCEEPRSLSLNPFVTFSSQSHVFSTNYGATSSKVTLCSSNVSEIGIERDNLIDDSPQVITTTSNSDIIISSFDPELTNMSQSPQNSGNVCSPEQYIELSEQIVPAVQISGADFVESSNDQLDDSQSVENNVPQNDVLNTDSES